MALLNRQFLSCIFGWALALTSFPPGAAPAPRMRPTLQQQSQSPPAQPRPDPARSRTFTGIVVRRGHDYLLRDESGSSYHLDSPERVQRFDGKSVKITGRLDVDSRTLHVDSIEPA
jgi:hypothetical protein